MSNSSARVFPRIVVEAVVVRACPECGKPPQEEDGTFALGECPHCHAELPPPEDLGIIHDNWSGKENKSWVNLNRLKSEVQNILSSFSRFLGD